MKLEIKFLAETGPTVLQLGWGGWPELAAARAPLRRFSRQAQPSHHSCHRQWQSTASPNSAAPPDFFADPAASDPAKVVMI